MPTSSQAMILRGSDHSPPQRSHVNVRFAAAPFMEFDRRNRHRINVDDGNREIVQIDFNLSTSPDGSRSVDGFEGVFAFDHKTKSYKWQIYPSSKKGLELPKIDQERSERSTEDQTSAIVNDKDARAFMSRNLSDSTPHYTTPSSSAVDTAEQLHVKEFIEESKRFDESAYRRLEELGFRRHTQSAGNILASRRGIKPQRAPSSRQSEPLATGNVFVTSSDDANAHLPASRTTDEEHVTGTISKQGRRKG